jgi:hypothetical protein
MKEEEKEEELKKVESFLGKFKGLIAHSHT